MVVPIRRCAPYLVLLFLLILPTVGSGLASVGSDNKTELPKEAVFKRVLKNGLVILIKETPKDLPSESLVAISIKIKAGPRFEGKYSASGISHVVEHMLFKGTTTRKPGEIEREIRSYGGFINGSVYHDITGLTVIIPAGFSAQAISILKDMLLNAIFEEGEFEKEREVILKEMGMGRDDPQDALMKLINETAYINHPYKYPLIGYEEELKSLKRQDLVDYYNKMYVPNRMVVTVVGNIERDGCLGEIEKDFEQFRAPDYEIAADIKEPVQLVKRTLSEQFPTNLSYLALAFHSTGVLNKDLFVMDLLAIILGRGENCRLNEELYKEKGLVHSIAAWNYTPIDPGLFVIMAVLDAENLAAAESSVLDQIARLKSGAIGDAELESAKKMALSDFIFSRETIESQVEDISTGEIFTGSYDFSQRYVNGIQDVSKDDIRRAASLYLDSDNLTVVRLIPRKTEAASAISGTVESGVMKKETMPNGLRILLRKDSKTPTVSITVAVMGGLLAENDNTNGISNLTAEMLLKGTASRKESEIKGFVEGLGGNLSSFSGLSSFGINSTVLKADLDKTLNVLKDVLTNSVFPQEELDREKIFLLAMIRDEDDNIFKNGVNILRRNLFKDHPYGLRLLGGAGTLASLGRKDVSDFYSTYCVPNNTVIAISGDIDEGPLAAKLKEAFKGWKPKEIPDLLRERAAGDITLSETINMDKDQSLVLMGFKTGGIKDPDKYALSIISSILSGSSGRLFAELRDKRALAYALGCARRASIENGYFIFYVATTNDKIEETRTALREEIGKIKRVLVSDEELLFAKREILTDRAIEAQMNGFFSYEGALDELYGIGYEDLYRYGEEIDKVTKEDIQKTAVKYFNPDKCAEVIIRSEKS